MATKNWDISTGSSLMKPVAKLVASNAICGSRSERILSLGASMKGLTISLNRSTVSSAVDSETRLFKTTCRVSKDSSVFWVI